MVVGSYPTQANYSYFKEFFNGKYHIYQLVPLHSCNYLHKIVITVNMTLNKQRNWSSYTKLTLSASWTHGLIGHCWLEHSWLEHLHGIEWLWVQISLRATFYSYFKESFSGEYHIMYIYCCIQMFFGHTVFLKLRIRSFSDTQKAPIIVTESSKIFQILCDVGWGIVSLHEWETPSPFCYYTFL